MTSPVPAVLPLVAAVPATQQGPPRLGATRFRP
jgi:hypothetical protein